MKTLAFYDTKPYDKQSFEQQLKDTDEIRFKYFENKLNPDTAIMAKGCDGVVAFVNDTIDARTIENLYNNGIQLIAMRCSGYNNIDFKAAYGKIHVLRVPAYSPYAVAEHAIGMLLTLNRKIHRGYNRTKDFNFSLSGLIGFDLHGKTIGVIGTGKIGQKFVDICNGFGMKVLAYDPYPVENLKAEYVSVDELCSQSDIISLHCPLTKDTKYIINDHSIKLMKVNAIIINTSRGALIDSEALLEALKSKRVGGAALDVYEEESELFFEDNSDTIIQDDVLARLLSLPNVLVTSHQAFLTNEALEGIAKVTIQNIKDFFDEKRLDNEICYHCTKGGGCKKEHKLRCF